MAYSFWWKTSARESTSLGDIIVTLEYTDQLEMGAKICDEFYADSLQPPIDQFDPRLTSFIGLGMVGSMAPLIELRPEFLIRWILALFFVHLSLHTSWSDISVGQL